MATITYRGHLLVMDEWEKHCAKNNDDILRKMATLEEYSESEEAYMEQCHAEYDARNREVDYALMWFVLIALFGMFFVPVIRGTRQLIRELKK